MADTRKVNQDEAYLLGLRQRDSRVLGQIYTRFFPMLAQHVRQRGGSEDDAKDVFQDTMVVLFRKLQSPDFQLTSSLGTFLMGVGRKVWLKKVSRRGSHPEEALVEVELEDEEKIETELEITERNRLFRAKLLQLGQDCQKVLRLFFAGIPMAQIAQKMGFASENYAKKRKFQCKQKLTKLIKEDPRFKELTYEGN
ncbi:MAG: sigma-70 family RNA polymerase sigma factor [Bacteroidota bacterium]